MNIHMAKPTAHTQNAARANLHISNLIVKKLRPFSDGDLVKECIDILVENMCPVKSSHIVVSENCRSTHS